MERRQVEVHPVWGDLEDPVEVQEDQTDAQEDPAEVWVDLLGDWEASHQTLLHIHWRALSARKVIIKLSANIKQFKTGNNVLLSGKSNL